MLHIGHLTDEVEVVIDDRVGDGGLAGGADSSAQVLEVNKSERKGGMRDVCSVCWYLSSVVGITEISLSKNVEVSGKD